MKYALHRTTTLVFTLVFLLVACASQREATIKGIFLTTKAARAAFSKIDDAQQAAIVAEAKTEAEGEAALAAHRVKRNKVIEVFTLVYDGILGALLLNDAQSLTDLITAAAQLKKTLDDFKNQKD